MCADPKDRAGEERLSCGTSRLELAAMASAVDHDLRNPLGVLKACAYNLKRKLPDDTGVSVHIANMEQKIRQSELLLDGLRKFFIHYSRASECIQICGFLERTVGMMEKDLPGSKGLLRLDLAAFEGENCRVEASEDLLGKMLIALCDNALRAVSGKAGGAVTIRAWPDPSKKSCALSVEDNGCGMDDETLQRVNEELFFSTKEGPRGLGLAVARYVARIHGASLILKSDKKEGTRVRVDLPLARV